MLRVLFLFLILALPSGEAISDSWRTADRSSMGIAPLPEEEPEALVQVYAARAYSWRGYFAVHTWIATKERNADTYVTYHVMGFRLRRTGTSVVVHEDIPDRRWFGSDSEILVSLKGDNAASLIPRIQELARTYPYHDEYRVWPGPNSNTFVSYILRNVPELGVELPPHAIGRDYMSSAIVGLSETGTGVQLSLFGLLGVTLGLGDGIEANILGLTLGIDFLSPALKLPFVGRLGFSDEPVFE